MTQQYYHMIFKALKEKDRDQFRHLFLKLHQRDQVQVFYYMYPEKKAQIPHMLSAAEFADLFAILDQDQRYQAWDKLDHDYMAGVFSHTPKDELTDFIQGLTIADQQAVLKLLAGPDRLAVEQLMDYPAETAGSLMTTEMVKVNNQATVDQVIDSLRQMADRVETLYYIYVVDEQDCLLGVISLRSLIIAEGGRKVSDLMTSQLITVDRYTDQEAISHIIKDYDLVAVPVLDELGQLVGIVTIDDIMDVVDLEVSEDFHKFAAIQSADEPGHEGEGILAIAKSRLPWIVILIFLGLISANLIAAFEDTIAQIVALAAFMPIIMDSAGNVGTQSLAVAVRRITSGEDQTMSLSKRVWHEFCAGVIIGLVAGFCLGLTSYLLHRNLVLSLIISISLWLTLSVSTVIGYLVPSLFTKLKIDPAVASGPFITTINDTFGLLIYFSLATYLLHLL
ncbi:hypothetical protein AWM75_04070 [Aerococcus urinaehominis]|uniref:Magnesium transporter MgtE n=1 Tax=Aerococcus urinaehominis TaxID=128944 RepID=A0A109RGN9_9LACT|nr:magnesium transporter [Aerococcus urinaehominis]AMB99233.1 hypothetical protein AWM75_04070 [Aerococcus urinaehominis]SDM31611.1 magnesium transporter [Aerococcus urinaehominis]